MAANVTSFVFNHLKFASFPRMTARLDIEDFFSVIDPNLIKCASNTFELLHAKVSTVYLTAAKLKLQRTCMFSRRVSTLR